MCIQDIRQGNRRPQKITTVIPTDVNQILTGIGADTRRLAVRLILGPGAMTAPEVGVVEVFAGAYLFLRGSKTNTLASGDLWPDNVIMGVSNRARLIDDITIEQHGLIVQSALDVFVPRAFTLAGTPVTIVEIFSDSVLGGAIAEGTDGV